MTGLATGITSGTPQVTSALNNLVSDVNTATGGMGGGILRELNIGGNDSVVSSDASAAASNISVLGSNSSNAGSDLISLAAATQTATSAIAQNA